MIERFLFTAIQTGIDRITANPELIEALFTNEQVPNPSFGLDVTEAARVRDFWENTADKDGIGPATVVHGYPHADSKFPGFFITLSGENEDTHFMARETGQLLDDQSQPDYGAPISGSIWKHTYSILVIAQHIDVTLYYYQLLKSFLIAGDRFLKSCGLIHLHYSGAELAPNKEWMPAGFYARNFTVACETEYNQVTPDGEGRAFQVAGIHVDAAGAPGEDVGSVKTLVTIIPPTVEGE